MQSMTLVQLEYIVALDDLRHFALAAESCFVTQPTLSMQIQKLEEELGVKIFDRTKQPVIPTDVGADIVAQARRVLHEARMIRQLISEHKGILSGELHIGIIPTLAPYPLPPLHRDMHQNYRRLHHVVRGAVTVEVLSELMTNRLDGWIVVTALNGPTLRERVLFYEELFVYVSRKNALEDKKY